MKLSELRSAIRSSSGNPLVTIGLGDISITVPVQKTAFDKALAAAFDGQRTAETGITFDEDTKLVHAVGCANSVNHQGDDLDLDSPAESDPLDDFNI